MLRKRRNLLFKDMGVALASVQFIASVIFCFLLFSLNMLPDRYSVGITVILLLLSFIVFLLQGKYVSGIVGKVFSVVMIAALIFGSSLLTDLNATLKSITAGGNVQKEKINVYIMADREIPTDAEASEFVYGIMASTQGESLDNMIAIMTDKFGGEAPRTAEYKTAEDLAEALYTEQVDAIILGESFVSIISDIEAYANFETDTKILYSEEFSIAIDSGTANLDSDTMIIYISGNDKTGSVEGFHRSDVNILAVVNTKTREILLVSTPRDYYVNLKFNDGTYSALPDKLTHAGNYGVEVSMNTLETIYDIDIDYYFRVNFTGFIEIVDALGGVDVYVPKNFTAQGAGTVFTQGNAHLSGAEALDFVRERYAFAGGDNRRGSAQMEVITSLLNKVMSPSVISGYREILDSLQRYFQTNIPSELISSLVKKQIDEGGDWNITSTSVEGTGSSEYTNSYPRQKLSVFLRNSESEAAAKELIQKVLNGESLESEEE